MANDPLDLWPDGMQVNQLTPLRILKLQAEKLRERTNGLLTAEVTTTEEKANGNDGPLHDMVHRFEILAPRWNGYRHQLFVCRHNTDYVYPVWIVEPESHGLKPTDAEAATQEEFTRVVRAIFSSIHTRSLISSLLARIADQDGTQPAA